MPSEDRPAPLSRLRRDDGFTLIETILTFSILVILLAAVLGALRLGVRSWERGERAIDGAAVKRALISRLDSDIASTLPYILKDGEGTRHLFEGKAASIGFVTSARGHSSLPWGGAKWVKYSKGEFGVMIREKTVPSMDVDADNGGSITELGAWVRELKFEYKGEEGWEESWNADEKKGVPSAVRVTMTLAEGGEKLSMATPIRTRLEK